MATNQYDSGPATVNTPTSAIIPSTDDASSSPPAKHALCAILSMNCFVQHHRCSPRLFLHRVSRYRSNHHPCCSSWRFCSARFHGLSSSGRCHSGVSTLVMGPAGDICRSRPHALVVQYSERDGSSQVSVHMTLEAMSSRDAWKSSGWATRRASQRLDSR